MMILGGALMLITLALLLITPRLEKRRLPDREGADTRWELLLEIADGSAYEPGSAGLLALVRVLLAAQILLVIGWLVLVWSS